MIKNVFAAVAQFLLFFIVFGIGSCSPRPKIMQTLGTTPEGTRVFVWDGLILMLAIFVFILLLELFRKRIRESAPWTVTALVAAAGIGFILKFGLLTIANLPVYR